MVEVPIPHPEIDWLIQRVRQYLVRRMNEEVSQISEALIQEAVSEFQRRWDYLASGRWLNEAYCNATGCYTSSHFDWELRQFFDEMKSAIIEEAQRHNIDGRAIAGVVAWEYKENLKGRFSDYIQNTPGRLGVSIGSGVGWGSVHDEIAKLHYPNASQAELITIRMEARTAVTLIAKEIGRLATMYQKLSNGLSIRANPPALALFYNTGERLLRRSAFNRRLTFGPNQPEVLDVSENDMATWVKENLDGFAEFRTEIKPTKMLSIPTGY